MRRGGGGTSLSSDVVSRHDYLIGPHLEEALLIFLFWDVPLQTSNLIYFKHLWLKLEAVKFEPRSFELDSSSSAIKHGQADLFKF